MGSTPIHGSTGSISYPFRVHPGLRAATLPSILGNKHGRNWEMGIWQLAIWKATPELWLFNWFGNFWNHGILWLSIYWEQSSQLTTHIFQRGWNHQPDKCCLWPLLIGFPPSDHQDSTSAVLAALPTHPCSWWESAEFHGSSSNKKWGPWCISQGWRPKHT